MGETRGSGRRREPDCRTLASGASYAVGTRGGDDAHLVPGRKNADLKESPGKTQEFLQHYRSDVEEYQEKLTETRKVVFESRRDIRDL